MTIIGTTTTGAAVAALQAGHAYGFVAGGALEHDFIVGSVIAYLDGAGGSAGTQVLRGVAAESGTHADGPSAGDDVTIDAGAPAQWVHLPFSDPPTLRAGYVPRIGIHTGPITSVARLRGVALGGNGSNRAASFPDGVPLLEGGAAVGLAPAIVMCGLAAWVPPTLEDEALAALPLDVAQAVLSTAPVTDPVAATAGWHGLSIGQRGSFAIVRTGGPLQDLVGERLRVTAGSRAVVVLVVSEQDFPEAEDEDISLAKLAFQQIAPLWTEALDVRVEVLG